MWGFKAEGSWVSRTTWQIIWLAAMVQITDRESSFYQIMNLSPKLLVYSLIFSAANKYLQNTVFIIVCYLRLFIVLCLLCLMDQKRVDLNSFLLVSELVKLPWNKGAAPLFWLLKHYPGSVFSHRSHQPYGCCPTLWTVQSLENQSFLIVSNLTILVTSPQDNLLNRTCNWFSLTLKCS